MKAERTSSDRTSRPTLVTCGFSCRLRKAFTPYTSVAPAPASPPPVHPRETSASDRTRRQDRHSACRALTLSSSGTGQQADEQRGIEIGLSRRRGHMLRTKLEELARPVVLRNAAKVARRMPNGSKNVRSGRRATEGLSGRHRRCAALKTERTRILRIYPLINTRGLKLVKSRCKLSGCRRCTTPSESSTLPGTLRAGLLFDNSAPHGRM